MQANIGSIAVILILLAVIALIIRRMILDKKAGRHICGGSCGSCGGCCAGRPMHGQCHGK
ncbi:MAG: FeoB-associated Cys-rich membrane protein [Clostridia bacterium]|nr:FeoB-associated Cys-rich membrane protein [Lachnospiraceae bacterium]MBP5727632.1 FeoB-associated Cys-rich membrane protein [Clostridia bacterium]